MDFDAIVRNLQAAGVQINQSEQLLLGNKCKAVFVGKDLSTGEKLVIKIGLDETGRKEIELNLDGYEEIRKIGASILLPQRVECLYFQNVPMLVLSHLGDDFWNATQKTVNPLSLYQYLVFHMQKVYEMTLRVSPETASVPQGLSKLIENIYFKKLKNYFDEGLEKKLVGLNLSKLEARYVCFSSFDFTPEDVFVTPSSVKYADPKPGQLGLPIVDMACFAGVAKDAHELPAAQEGYSILLQYATTELASLLGLKSDVAHLYFEIGRVIQLGLSGYYRLDTDPKKAIELITLGGKKLADICS